MILKEITLQGLYTGITCNPHWGVISKVYSQFDRLTLSGSLGMIKAEITLGPSVQKGQALFLETWELVADSLRLWQIF